MNNATLAAQFRKILTDKTLVSRNAAGGFVLVEENVMQVEVTQVFGDVTAIKVDALGSFGGLREGEWKQVCDYILVHSHNGKDVFVFVELKKTLDSNRAKGREQLFRSLPLLSYLYRVCKIHFNSLDRQSTTKVSYCLICEKSSMRLDKQPVSARRSRCPLRYRNIRINQLIGSAIRFEKLCAGQVRASV